MSYGFRFSTIERFGTRETMAYGPADGGVSTPPVGVPRPVGTAQKNGIAIRARKSGAGFASVTTRYEQRACTAVTSETNCVAGDSSRGLRIRWNACAKLRAVTRSPFEKRVKPASTSTS